MNSHAAPGPLLYGGTFDPIHEGHLTVARTVAQASGQPVHLMPAALPPHRAAPGASDQQRLAMLRLAIGTESQLRVDDRELQRNGPSFTVLTLRECVAAGQRPVLILGWDAFCGLPGWREPEAIMMLAILIVVPRPEPRPEPRPDLKWHANSSTASPVTEVPSTLQSNWHKRQELSPATLATARAGDVLFCPMPEQPISATAIRLAIAAGERPLAGLPRVVAAYIDEQKLYES